LRSTRIRNKERKTTKKEKHIKLNRKEYTKIKDKMSAYQKKIINMIQASGFSKVCKLEVDHDPKQRKKNCEKEKHKNLKRKK